MKERKSLGKLFSRYDLWQNKRLVLNHTSVWYTHKSSWTELSRKCRPWRHAKWEKKKKKVRILPEYEGEFQNHRKAEVGRDIWGTSISTPLLKARSTQVAQEHVQLGFENLQGWRLHNLFRKSGSVFDHTTVKKVFSYVLVIYAHYLFSIHWTPLRRVLFCLLYPIPSGIYAHW